MTFSHFLLPVAALSMIGCASQPAPPAHDAGTATVLGAHSADARVLIQRVDNGPILYVAPGAIGSKVSITPGHHTVKVMCQLGGAYLPGEVTFDVEAGKVYELTASAGASRG